MATAPCATVDEGIRCDAVKFSYKIDTVREIILEHPVEILREVNFVVPRKQRTLLVGANGAGKTSLLRLVAGVATADAGRIDILGRSWSEERRLLNSKVVLVAESNWGGGVASIQVSELIENAKRRALEENHEDSERLEMLAVALRIHRVASKSTEALSDGERRSVHLFVALAPPSVEVVLLDEACMELDVLVRAGLYGFLRKWEYTVIFATHVFDGVEELGLMDEVIFLNQQGKTALVARENEEESFYTLTRRLLTTEAQETLSTSPFSLPGSQSEIVSTNTLTWHYSPELAPALRNLSLSVHKGHRVLLVGMNGSGKSTLLALLAGARLVTSETMISVFGANPRLVNHRATGRVALLGGTFKSSLASLPQRAAQMHFAELLQHAKHQERAQHLVTMLQVDTNWRPATASAGQQTRMQLVLQLSQPAELYLVDELTRDLDLLARDRLLHFLAQEDATVVYATHIFQGLERWATDLIHLRRGELVAHPEDIDFSHSIYQTVISWLQQDNSFPSSDSSTITPGKHSDRKRDSPTSSLPVGWAARDNSAESSFGGHAWSARSAHGRFADRHSPQQRFESLYLAAASSNNSSSSSGIGLLQPRPPASGNTAFLPTRR